MKPIRKLYVAISDPSSEPSVIKMENCLSEKLYKFPIPVDSRLITLLTNIVRNVYMLIRVMISYCLINFLDLLSKVLGYPYS